MWPISLRRLLDNDRQDDQGELDSKDRPGHGTKDMPVWGSHFRTEALLATRYPDVDAEEIVQGRILGLVYYIQSPQVE